MSVIDNAIRIARAEGGVAKTATPQFKNWFGDSKVVDGQGQPLTVYHGTTNADKILQNGFKKGWTHLTDSKPVADSYQQWKRGETSATLPLYASLKNPAHYDAQGKKYTDIGNKVYGATYDAEKAGHDGLVIHNIRDNYDSGVPTKPHTTYVAFNPTQIKHATDNEGTFDPTNPSILKAKGGVIEKALRIARAEGGATTTSITQGHKIKLHTGPIHSRVSGRTDHLPVHVPSGAYVLPADIVSAMGEGNTTAGFEHVKRMFGGLPYGGHGSVPYAGGAGPYGAELPRSTGGNVPTGAPVPCVVAGGEFILSPEQVHSAGDGDMDAGHRALDAFVKNYRAKTIKTLKGLPGPKKD